MINPLSQSALDEFRAKLQNPDTSAKELFRELKALYKSHFINIKSLSMMEYGVDFIHTADDLEQEYILWTKKFDEVESLGSELTKWDEQIKEKTKAGMLNDPLTKDAVIAEQEQFDQERLTFLGAHNELQEINKVHQAKHDQALQTVQKIMMDATATIKEKSSEFGSLMFRKYFWVKFKTRVLTLIPTLGFPFLLDYLSQTAETKALASEHLPPILRDHYVFFISFLLLELFFVDRIKDWLSHYFAKSACQESFDHLTSIFPITERELDEAEKKYGISPGAITEKMESFLLARGA